MDKFHFFNICFFGFRVNNAFIQVRNKQVTYIDIEDAKKAIIKEHRLNADPTDMVPACISYLGYMT